ncbi:MAG: gliding motility-associated C-terminal domain-containing protein [Bacteroidales bacterium]|nr:gliding motility-associated C-terminal domain-containing protein [Bacteroidales bacterium]
MGKIKVILTSFFIIFIFSVSSNAQIDQIAFKDSVHAATFTHYFIPMKISNNDTTRLTDTEDEDIASIEWTKNGNPVDFEPIRNNGNFIAYRHKFSEAGNYEIGLEIADRSGLIHFTSKTIFVENSIEVPNVFSPDENGINDVFVVKSNGEQKLKLEIYTRNGDLIYERTGTVIYWDGKMASGNFANQGVYYYVVKSPEEPEVIKKGFFHLFR